MSTIKVTNVNPPTAGDAVNINGLAYPTAGPLGNRNLIINGAMQVAQRGTSSTSTGYQTVDRFRDDVVSGTVTQSQESLTSGTPYDEGFRNFYRLTNTTASSDNAAGMRDIRHQIEAQNLANSGWNYTSSSSYVTLSFWVRASVSQEYFVQVRSRDGTSQRYTFSTGTLTADTWTKVTKTIPGNSNITFDNDNGLGLEFYFVAFFGTNYTDSGVTLDTWDAYASGTRVPDMTATWSTTTDATFDITGVQLEVGSVATPFEHRSYGDELARCQRYYQRITADTDNEVLCVGYSEGTTSSRGTVFLRTTMRAAPSAIDTTGTASDYEVRNGSLNINMTSITIDRTTPDTVSCNFNVSSGLTSATANLVRFRLANSYLGMSAEL